MKNKFKKALSLLNKWDWGLIIVLLVLALVFFVLINRNNNRNLVVIEYNNEVFKTADLNKDQTINVDHHIIVEIKDQKVRIKQSDCKNQLCVKQGWTTINPLICVPNHVIVKIEKSKEELKKETKMLITY